jgi:membrane protease subunit HflK
MLWLGSGFFTVGPGEVGVKLRFGRVIASDLQPGLHFRLAWPFESHRLIAQTSVRRLEFGMPKPPPRAEAADARSRDRRALAASPASNDGMARATLAKEPAPQDASLLTGDNNLIDLRSAVQYRVKSALAYEYNLAEPDALVRSTISRRCATWSRRALSMRSTPPLASRSNAPLSTPRRQCWIGTGLE